jgi:radical SAM family uncharacterized protein
MCNNLDNISKTNYFTPNKPPGYYLHYLKLAIRLYRAFFLNTLGLKYPYVSGHKLTYNCNLKCSMCPFWKRSYKDTSLQDEKRIIKALYDAGVCLIAFEGGEPLLREDLPEILEYSKALGMSTSIITNGVLLSRKIDSIAPYVDGSIYVSLDGIGETHDRIRGSNGCYDKAIEGIRSCAGKAFVTINTTIMKENVGEVPELVKLAKELKVGISLALVYNYDDISIEQLSSREISKVANTLIDLKRQGYPIVHSVDYLRIMGGEQSWDCKPWLVANVDPEGRVVQPCYCLSNYKSSTKVSDVDIGSLWRKYDWSRYKGCSKCSLHCYVEPSLIQSFNIGTYRNWGRVIRKI